MGQRERRWWHYALPAFLLTVLAALALTWTGATPVTTESATQETDTLAHGSKGMAGSLPHHPVSSVSFRTGLEKLPASLEGTVVPDGLQVDAQGNLVITPLLRDVMEYFLSTLGEEDLATIVQRLQAYFANNLPATAAEQAQQILNGYLAWRDNLGQIPQAGGVDAARLDVDAVRAGLADGALDIIATDHAPHHYDEKEAAFEDAPNGIVGLETAVGIVLTRVVNEGVIDLATMVERMSCQPARAFGQPGGTLTEGSVGDVSVLDLDAQWTVDAAAFLSKSRNTPFAGWVLQGAPVRTIVGGKTVWEAAREDAT